MANLVDFCLLFPDPHPASSMRIQSRRSPIIMIRADLDPHLWTKNLHKSFLGPFANIAHGNSSIIADQIRLVRLFVRTFKASVGKLYLACIDHANYSQCCGAGPFLTGSGSEYFFHRLRLHLL